MAGTTVVAARQALAAALQARPALQTGEVQITYDYPDERGATDAIWTAWPEVEADSRIPVLRTSPKRREEDYQIIAIIDVRRETTIQLDADLRAIELLAEVEETLAVDPHLGIPSAISWARLSGYRPSSGPWQGGRACRFEAFIAVKARLL